MNKSKRTEEAWNTKRKQGAQEVTKPAAGQGKRGGSRGDEQFDTKHAATHLGLLFVDFDTFHKLFCLAIYVLLQATLMCVRKH